MSSNTINSSNRSILFFDIEGNGLLYDLSEIHCIVAYDPQKQKYLVYHSDDYYQEITRPNNCIYYPEISMLLRDFKDKYTLVAHNLFGYDRLALEKMYGYTHPIDDCIDTFVMSSVQYPDREAHSIQYYGDLFRMPKGDHNDFSKFSQEMLDYCIQDVNILKRTYEYLLEEQEGWDWEQSMMIENRIADIMARQELHGVLFNVEKAEELVTKIDEEVREIETSALAEIPKRAVMVGAEIKKPFLKTGGYTKQVESWINTL